MFSLVQLAGASQKQVKTNRSGFVRQKAVQCIFGGNESWVVLSPIEQAIKAKIEKAGKPLKDWDIQIYRGILTGCNEAFIVGEEKRAEILANCKSADERKRTDALIRPILRGRDIKRYSYDWAGLYVIATFPALHLDIELYPAVKRHLLTFGMERLEQTGKTHTKDGIKITARKKTNNKWFETQDQIGYWEDFSRPKIIYPNMTKYMPFYLDRHGFMTNQKCFIISGSNIAFLTAFLNSSLFKFCFRENFPELQGGTRELSKVFFDKVKVLQVNEQTDSNFQTLVAEIQGNNERSKVIKDLLVHIDTLTFNLYNLSDEERKLIGFIEIQ